MSERESCSRCPVLEQEIDRLEAEVKRLREEIKLLKRRIRYLKDVMKTVLAVVEGLYVLIMMIMRVAGKIVKQKSGVPPTKWQRNQGRFETAKLFRDPVIWVIYALKSAIGGG